MIIEKDCRTERGQSSRVQTLELGSLLSLCAVFVSACGPFGSSSVVSSSLQQTGCTVTTPPHVAPGGYYVNGNTICTESGRAHLFHGVDRPSLEWSNLGDHLTATDFQNMASWKANVVRVALNQDFWLEGSPYQDPTYPERVDRVIGWAERAGLDVILDLHWSDQGTLGSCDPSKGCQQVMADANSATFWHEVADRYKGDGRVLFELYNEPHDIEWNVWRNGGATGKGWNAVGMQQLLDTVRAAGADNLVIAGGLGFAYDLTGIPGSHLDGYNVLYATHPYNNSPDRVPGKWEGAWGFVTQSYPVVVTEFGDVSPNCTGDFDTELIRYADAHFASWTAWAWYVAGACSFPSIIKSWQGTPSIPGEQVRSALVGYPDDPPSSSEVRTGADGGLDDAGLDGGGLDDAGDEGGTDDASSAGDASSAADALVTEAESSVDDSGPDGEDSSEASATDAGATDAAPLDGASASVDGADGGT